MIALASLGLAVVACIGIYAAFGYELSEFTPEEIKIVEEAVQ